MTHPRSRHDEVFRLLEAGATWRAIISATGIDSSVWIVWVRRERPDLLRGGRGGGSQPRDWSAVLAEIERGISHAEMARRLGLSRARICQVVARWRKERGWVDGKPAERMQP